MKIGRLIICWVPRDWPSYRVGITVGRRRLSFHVIFGKLGFLWASDAYLRYVREFGLRGGA